MKCPNCHCEMGSNVGICQYCGFDVASYLEKTFQIQESRKRDYEWAYWQEKMKADEYRGNIMLVFLAGILFMQVLILILLAFLLR